jgi:hypothetical protein
MFNSDDPKVPKLSQILPTNFEVEPSLSGNRYIGIPQMPALIERTRTIRAITYV